MRIIRRVRKKTKGKAKTAIGGRVLSSINFEPNQRVLKPFRNWIKQFSPEYAKRWTQLYNDNPEAAMCEASFWAVMDDCGVTVEPNPNITPDYVCLKDGKKFYVEVTCIQIDTATRKTNLTEIPEPGKSTNYQSLNEAIRNECVSKTPKCANRDAPCVLAVGTFHYHASALALDKRFMEWLHTDPCIGLHFDPRVGQIVGDSFELQRRGKSVFTYLLDGGCIANIRRPLSALLIAGFGCEPPFIRGLLNPAPVREFDPSLLSRIPFCLEKTDFLKGEVRLEWIQTQEKWARI